MTPRPAAAACVIVAGLCFAVSPSLGAARLMAPQEDAGAQDLGPWPLARTSASPHAVNSRQDHDNFNCGGVGSIPPVRMVLSEDATSFAYVGAKGSRQVVFHDGRPGPAFDEIGAASGLVFCPRGQRLAYLGRNGDNWHVVVDGQVGPAFQYISSDLTFSADGSRIAYVGTNADRTEAAVVDQVPGAPCLTVKEMAFSPDGSRLVYVAAREEDKKVTNHVVAGDLDLPYSNSLMFLADGRLAFVGPRENGLALYVDDLPGDVFDILNGVCTDPSRSRIAYVAGRATEEHEKNRGRSGFLRTPGGVDWFIVADGVRIPLPPNPNDQKRATTRIWLEEGGDGVAFLDYSRGGVILATPDERGAEYESILEASFHWTDGKPSYLASKIGRVFPIRAGQEGEGLVGRVGAAIDSASGRPVISISGGGGIAIVQDGRLHPAFDSVIQRTLGFSRDGRRMIYHAIRHRADLGDVGQFIVVDGTAIYRTSDQGVNGPNVMPSITPDGNHAYWLLQRRGASPNGRGVGPLQTSLVVDGRDVATVPNERVLGLTLSPDGRHFAYWKGVQRGGDELELIIDGRSDGFQAVAFQPPAVEQMASSVVELRPWARAAGAFDADGRFTFLDVSDGRIRRVVRPVAR